MSRISCCFVSSASSGALGSTRWPAACGEKVNSDVFVTLVGASPCPSPDDTSADFVLWTGCLTIAGVAGFAAPGTCFATVFGGAGLAGDGASKLK